MDRIRIKGGRQLKGEIRISGSKNASLPLMVAALLTDRKLTLHNVPRLADITTMIQLLKQHGVEIGAAPGENGHARGTTLTLQAGKITSTTAPYDIVRKMRASVLVLGAAAGARGRGAGVAARRLRHRRAAGRPAHRRPEGDGRADRHRRRLPGGQGAQGPARARASPSPRCRSAPPRT